MAPRAVQIIAGAALAAFVIAALAAVWVKAGPAVRFGPAEWAALRFTLLQAALSAALSVLLAIPLARALARSRFWGRDVTIMLLGAPFILPVIVAVLGLIAIFGQNGLLNDGLRALGFEPLSIYGLQGVLLAHVFFNLPLATRMILLGWMSLPSERIRLGQSLGLGTMARFYLIEWPMIRRILPSAFAVIFVICLSSFAVALTLGGGPKATTIELAIYQAFRFEFDFATAALLGLVQLFLSVSAAGVALWLAGHDRLGIGLDRPAPAALRPLSERCIDAGVIFGAMLFLILPLALLFIKGAAGVPDLGAPVWFAALRSLALALGATLLCLCFALPLATRWGELIATLGIAVSPLVQGTGLFLIVRPYVNPFDVALGVTLCVNALMSLPFALRILRPEVQSVEQNFSHLSAALGLGAWGWFRWVMLPRLRRPLGFAAGLTAALSMGDLGVIALFGDAERATLPLKLYQLMGSYRMDQAAAAAVLLLALSLGLFWLFDRVGRYGAQD